VVRILERGDISFFYRPVVQPAEAPVLPAGVQAFFAVLSPAGGRIHRRLRVGRKRMPVAARERFWARVERVGSLDRVLADQLEAERYHTRTRGDRYQPGARPIAQGTYAFVRHDDHLHLVYRIAHRETDEVPGDAGVRDAASHLVLFERVPRGRAVWTAGGEPAQLDDQGAEIVLVGGDDDPERELGIDLLGEPTPVG
jgi:hypothetical protein